MKMNSWGDFWERFNELIDELNESENADIVSVLRETQLHVNGLTDGWNEFKSDFESIVDSNKVLLTIEQLDKANELIKVLSNALDNR